MSITYCNDCFALIDTDKDTEFYDFKHKTKTGYGGHCFICRAQFDDYEEGASTVTDTTAERPHTANTTPSSPDK